MFNKVIFRLKDAVFMEKMSSNLNIIFGLSKVILALLSTSILVLLYAVYNICLGITKRTAVRQNQKHSYQNYYFVGILILASSFIYIGYSIYIYFFGDSAKYHEYVAIGIAALAFYNITMAIIGVAKSRKQNDIQRKNIKLINLASAFISISLTQTALLSFTLGGDNSKYNAIGGIIFGGLSAFVGLYMILGARRTKN